MSSKCKRLQLALSPAFCLETVHVSNANPHDSNSHSEPVNAATCQEMSEILPYLVLGSWRDAADIESLHRHGVTHVLNMAKEVPSQKEQEAMSSSDFTQKTIPLVDCHSENISERFEEAFAFIEHARQSKGKALVHCRRGISRSPAIVVGYLMRHERKSYQEAIDFVKERRSCISLNLAFRSLLEEYNPPPSNSSTNSMDRNDSTFGEDFGLSVPSSEQGLSKNGKCECY